MKFTIITFVLLSMLPAYADDSSLAQELLQLNNLARCQAFDVSLLQLHDQVAASIATLSSNPPKEISSIRDSYLAMATEDKKRLDKTKNLIVTEIAPKLGADREKIAEQFRAQLSDYVGQIQLSLANIHYEDQIKVQQMLMDGSQKCEAYVGQMTKKQL